MSGKKITPRERRESVTGWILAAPVLIGVFVFFGLPFGISLWYSVTFGVGGAQFVGLDNYIKVFSSEAFRLAAFNTVRFLGIGIPLIMLSGFAIALLIKKSFDGSRIFRSVLLLPMVIPVASVVMVVQVFFAEGGILNGLLEMTGYSVENWLHSPSAFYILVGMYVWKNCGYNVVLMLAGLNMIPDELYQTAAIEGAGEWKKFRFITLPLVWPSLFFTFVMSIVNSFKSYREAFLLGGAHPHDSIYMLQHFLNNNFDNLNYQRLSVASTMLFLAILLVVGVLYVLQDKHGEAVQ